MILRWQRPSPIDGGSAMDCLGLAPQRPDHAANFLNMVNERSSPAMAGV
jgi:hypothetical protein